MIENQDWRQIEYEKQKIQFIVILIKACSAYRCHLRNEMV